MKIRVLCAWGALWLSACSSAALRFSVSDSGTGTGGSSTGSSDAGADAGAPAADAGPLGQGSGCDPSALIDPCEASGLVCDVRAATCRLPALGEPCVPEAGCATTPAKLGCYQVTVGAPAQLCLVPCNTADSSNCPYGSSCGDPNLPGFCSTSGSPNCAAWSSCALAPGLSGTCVPDGTHNACLASGSQQARYGTCNPAAANADSAVLCAGGAVCLAWSAELGSIPDAGNCFPLCWPDGGVCASGEHCDQPDPLGYGVCRPGQACRLDLDTCPVEAVCLPDRLSSLAGGCLPTAGDAGGLGAPCQLLPGVALVSVCQQGLCIAGDGGSACQSPCDLADAGGPSCVSQVCSSVSAPSTTEVVGICR